ncbi:MFS transporter [Sphingomonas lycopersici]|nr:MFS transporter [Sphingomonas lycopersici]
MLWLIGVLAAAQFARMAVVAPLMRTTLGLTLSQAGWLISLLEVGGALFGFVAGLALARVSVHRFLLLGLAILAGTGLVEAIATGATTLFVARAAEGIGYLFVVIAAPTAIAATASDAIRPRALALWSTFVPVGIAAGAAVSGFLLTVTSMRGTALVWVSLVVASGVLVARFRIAGSAIHAIRLPAPAAWVSTFGFGLYTIFISALTMLLPSFLIEQAGATMGQSALSAACASLGVLPATAAAMLVMRNDRMSARRSATIAAVSLLAAVPFVLALYRIDGLALLTRAALAVLAVTVSGLVPPIVFARLPQLAGATTPDDPRIATANGLITQFGAGGALIGPPLGGLIVGWSGWSGLGVAASLLLIAMLAAFVLAEMIGAGAARLSVGYAAPK